MRNFVVWTIAINGSYGRDLAILKSAFDGKRDSERNGAVSVSAAVSEYSVEVCCLTSTSCILIRLRHCMNVGNLLPGCQMV